MYNRSVLNSPLDYDFLLVGTFLAILEFVFVFLLVYLVVECWYGRSSPPADPD
jgi:hypothetical protein